MTSQASAQPTKPNQATARTVIALGILFIAMQAADVVLTNYAVGILGYAEANPLMANIVGTPMFTLLKIPPAIMVTGLCARVAMRMPALAVLGLMAANVFMVAVLATNVAKLF